MTNRKVLWVSFIVLGFISWFIANKLLVNAMILMKLTNALVAGFVPISQVLALVLSAIMIYYLIKNEQVYAFSNDVVTELKKVTWPSRKETTAATIVVIITVIIFSIILGLFDFIWVKLLHLVIK
jgi:preprotein translocase subunit SecE